LRYSNFRQMEERSSKAVLLISFGTPRQAAVNGVSASG
jgi:hypothetical protein